MSAANTVGHRTAPRLSAEEVAAVEAGIAGIGTAHHAMCLQTDNCKCEAEEAALRALLARAKGEKT